MTIPNKIERRGDWMRHHGGGPWHLAVRVETYYQVSGKVASVYHKTACSGAGLYSVWGAPRVEETPPINAPRCKRCAALAAKVTP